MTSFEYNLFHHSPRHDLASSGVFCLRRRGGVIENPEEGTNFSLQDSLKIIPFFCFFCTPLPVLFQLLYFVLFKLNRKQDFNFSLLTEPTRCASVVTTFLADYVSPLYIRICDWVVVTALSDWESASGWGRVWQEIITLCLGDRLTLPMKHHQYSNSSGPVLTVEEVEVDIIEEEGVNVASEV